MSTVNDVTEEIPFDIPDTWRWVRHNQLFANCWWFSATKIRIFGQIQEQVRVR